MSKQLNCLKHFYFKLFMLFQQLYITIQFSVSSVSMSKLVQFQTIQFSISTQFKRKYSLIVKTFLFQAIQFSQLNCVLTFKLRTYAKLNCLK